MYAKLENGQLRMLPKSYEYGGISYSNYDMLDEPTLLSHGWKPFIDTPMPEPQEGAGYTPVYIDDGGKITVHWDLYEIPESVPELAVNINEFILGLLEGYYE